MQNDLSPEDSEFLENLRTHLDWRESWFGEWDVSVYPVENAYMSMRGSRDAIKKRYLNPSEWCTEITPDGLQTNHITFEIDEREDSSFSPSVKVSAVKQKCRGVANM